MAVWSSYAFILMVMLLETLVVSQDCDTVRNVALSVIEPNTCPSEPVTARCVVKKTIAPVVLVWKVTEVDKECNVLCKEGPVICDVEEIYDVKVTECSCNETVITSEATFKLTSKCNVMLSCSSRDREEQVSVSIKGLNKPSLSMNYTIANIKSETYEVRVWWTEGDCAPLDVDYVVSFTNSSSGETVNAITNQTQMTLTLYRGTNYTVTVTAQLCGGNLTSETSKKLPLYYPGDSSITSGNSPSNQDSKIPVAGGVVAAVAVTVAVITAFLGYICWRIRHVKVVRGNIFVGRAEKLMGEGLTTTEVSNLTIKDIGSKQKTGIGGLYVDEEHIYYSSCETLDDGKKEYTLCKCHMNGTSITTIAGFNHIRGIGRDDSGNTYVVDSLNSRVLKFDNRFTALRKTCSKNRVACEPFGILVTRDYVFVCANRENRICVMNYNLDLVFDIKQRGLIIDPSDITELDGTFFVATYAAIVAINIDFQTSSFKARKIEKMMIDGAKPECFSDDKELRGICADHQYLYVTEYKSRILCLRYDLKGHLHYVDSIKDCSPLVVACHGGTVYFSRSTPKNESYIAKITQNELGTLGYEDLFKV